MKQIYVFGVVVLLLAGFPLHAQSTWRCGNDGMKGHHHLLVVYAEFRDYGEYGVYCPPDNWGYTNDLSAPQEMEAWIKGEIPTIVRHSPEYPAGQNRLFNTTLPIGEKGQIHNVSEYYSLQSGGELQLTADIFQFPLRLSFSEILARANAEGTGKQGFYSLANQATWAQLHQIPAFAAAYTPEKWQEVLVFYRILSPLPDSLFDTKSAQTTLLPNPNQPPLTAIEGASGNWIETLRTLLIAPAPEGFWTAPAYYNLPLSTFIFQK